MVRNLIIRCIDFFYPPFARLMPLQTFRYAACGGANTVLDIALYTFSYHFILHKQVTQWGAVAVSPHIMAFLLAFMVSFPLGFLLMRYVVFTESDLKGRVQLFRYFLMVLICLLLNYIFIKLFVEHFHFYPTIAKICTTVIVVGFSYLSQKHFSFKVTAGKAATR